MINDTTNIGSYPERNEDVVLVPVSSFENLTVAYHVAETIAEIIVDEWEKAAEKGYGHPSDAMKTILRLYNPARYADCVAYQKVAQKEAEKKFKEKLEKEMLNPGPIYPYNPYPATDPGVLKKAIEITCESKDGESE